MEGDPSKLPAECFGRLASLGSEPYDASRESRITGGDPALSQGVTLAKSLKPL